LCFNFRNYAHAAKQKLIGLLERAFEFPKSTRKEFQGEEVLVKNRFNLLKGVFSLALLSSSYAVHSQGILDLSNREFSAEEVKRALIKAKPGSMAPRGREKGVGLVS
jgi:hypothetical protein